MQLFEPIARVKDIVFGKCGEHRHPKDVWGIIVSGENTVITAGLPTSTQYDVIVFECGHVALIISGTEKCVCKGRLIGRYTSVVAGQVYGLILTGVPTVVAW
jgi:hypothetical protein